MNKKKEFIAYETRKRRLIKTIKQTAGKFHLKKKTPSNLFRYQSRKQHASVSISLQDFDHVLCLDKQQQTLDTEGLATYETIVNYTLRHGFLPTIAPELKNITLGGATVGIGIESNCFKYGFVHDGLIEAELLLPDGNIVICRSDNEHADLFNALPNSYGTLGYILRAKIRLYPAKPYVQLTTTRHHSSTDYLIAMKHAASSDTHDFVEGLFYKDDEFYLTTGSLVDKAPAVNDIYRSEQYYKQMSNPAVIYLRTLDYIFRFDPDWFWNIPNEGFYKYFREYAPLSMRKSSFYKRYTGYKARLFNALNYQPDVEEEPLIQDWEVPWEKAGALISFALKHVDLEQRPWAAVPIVPLSSPTSYPIKSGQLYFNLGCYCYVNNKHIATKERYYFTKLIDKKCFELGGIKMLYSSTFLNKADFDRIYNGKGYDTVKAKYDPQYRTPSLFEKAVTLG